MGEHDLMQLREKYLKTKLKILGYEDISDINKEVGDSAGYRALRRIGRDLETFATRINPAFKEGQNNEQEVQSCAEEIELDRVFMQNQDEFFGKIRKVYEYFGLDMKEKVSEQDWKIYADVVRKTANLLNKLVRGSKKSNLNESPTLEQEDAISVLIDSQDFARACKIEDAFMKSEYENFLGIVDSYTYNGEEIEEISSAAELADLLRESEAISNQKEEYIVAFNKFEEFLNSIKGHITITNGPAKKKLGENVSDEER